MSWPAPSWEHSFSGPKLGTPLTVKNENSDDDYEDVADEDSEDENALRSGTFPLGLSKSYVPKWKPKDAFREFYQNWKDAIISRFGLDPRSFKPTLEPPTKTGNLIQITLRCPPQPNNGNGNGNGNSNSKGDLLGYIRFDKKAGSLELTNFKAQLNMEHLRLGGTSKRHNDRLAGTHGEGFKLAALVMLREGHAVRFRSSSYSWNFSFKGQGAGTLQCKLAALKPSAQDKKRRDYEERKSRPRYSRDLTANAWEDVTVKMTKAKGKPDSGISEEDFREWMKVSLDLSTTPPEHCIDTDWGTLILDSRFAGHTYLKGLRINGYGKQYVLGYNLWQGEISRDRESLKSEREESWLMGRIWDKAITSGDTEVVDAYLKLFYGHKECTDLRLTKDNLSPQAIQVLWSRIRLKSPEAFFYVEADSLRGQQEAVKVITVQLKRTPETLPRALWDMLRRFTRIRIPEEEMNFRFRTSETVDAAGNPFGSNIFRALRAMLMLHPRLSEMSVEFVTGGGTEVDVAFQEQDNMLQVHEKWLDFHKVHNGYQCEVLRLAQSQENHTNAFFCDHAVEDLFEAVLSRTMNKFDIPSTVSKALQCFARERFRLTPRQVEISQTRRARQLQVSWIGNESGYVSQNFSDHVKYYITLHNSWSCKNRRRDLLYATGENQMPFPPYYAINTPCSIANCDCPSQTVSRSVSTAIFDGLDPQTLYFPMVSRVDQMSFMGTPPDEMRPRSEDMCRDQAPVVSNPPKHPTAGVFEAANSFDAEGISATTFGFNDSDNEDINMTNTTPRTARQISSVSYTPVLRSRFTPRPRATISSPSNTYVSPTIDESAGVQGSTHDVHEANLKFWEKWHIRDMPAIFAQMIPKRKSPVVDLPNTTPSLICLDLDFTFEKDEFAYIQLQTDKVLEHVIYVRDIRYGDDPPTPDSIVLLVTKYSILGLTPLFGEANCQVNARELLLHFKHFDKMGAEEDAELIRFDEIIHAQAPSSRFTTEMDHVRYVGPTPSEEPKGALFCRFGICAAEYDKVVCFTPLGSKLLDRGDQWKSKIFANPSHPLVFDLAPAVLGPSEGFSKVGFDIKAAIGFDPERHLTWKIRHQSSYMYDGSPQSVFDAFDSGQLDPSGVHPPLSPRVALVAGKCLAFRLDEKDKDLPHLDDFLQPLYVLQAAARSSLNFDFYSAFLPAATLHKAASGQLAATIFSLLKQKRSVHLKLCSFQQYGLPQDRTVLCLVASPMRLPIAWTNDQIQRRTLREKIGDLAFVNPRLAHHPQTGFVCPLGEAPGVHSTEDVQATTEVKLIYNHLTGQKTESGSPEIPDLDAHSLRPFYGTPPPFTHADRQDLLTVREIARIQGFPDDFVFYYSYLSQLKDVWRAIPPVIAETVGRLILRTIEQNRMVTVQSTNRQNGKLGQKIVSGRSNYKRPRVEDHDGDE